MNELSNSRAEADRPRKAAASSPVCGPERLLRRPPRCLSMPDLRRAFAWARNPQADPVRTAVVVDLLGAACDAICVSNHRPSPAPSTISHLCGNIDVIVTDDPSLVRPARE